MPLRNPTAAIAFLSVNGDATDEPLAFAYELGASQAQRDLLEGLIARPNSPL
jgi:hypothetical protein